MLKVELEREGSIKDGVEGPSVLECKVKGKGDLKCEGNLEAMHKYKDWFDGENHVRDKDLPGK